MRFLYTALNGGLTLTNDLMTPPGRYAILSHTWGAEEDEVTFDDVEKKTGKNKAGYAKLWFCVNQAKKDGLEYCWVDTCCINKASLSELSEAITSMFRWYQQACKCYVYLPDVLAGNRADWELSFRASRWFTRGWTLQELLAPESVEFFSLDGQVLGTKHTLEQIIHEITGISRPALQGVPLLHFSIEERIQWTVARSTKKVEDKAYCLLGIFNVYIPLIYGEGENASKRLREEIIRTSGAEAPWKFTDSALGTSLPSDAATRVNLPFDSRRRIAEVSEREDEIFSDEENLSAPDLCQPKGEEGVSLLTESHDDSDLASVLTQPDDLDSLTPSQPSILLRHGEVHVAAVLLQNGNFKQVCELAASSVGVKRASRQVSRLLKYLYVDLCASATDAEQYRPVTFLKGRWSRNRIAGYIFESLNPDGNGDEVKTPDQAGVDKSLLLERFLGQSDWGWPSPGDQDSDSDTGDLEPSEQDFARLRKIESFVRDSEALTSLTYGVSRFLLPAQLTSLLRQLVSIDLSQLSILEQDRLTWQDRVKNVVEKATAWGWHWYPMTPPKRHLAGDEARVYWHCHCGSLMWSEIPRRHVDALRLALQCRPAHETSSHVCWRRRFRSRATNLASGSSSTASAPTQTGLNTSKSGVTGKSGTRSPVSNRGTRENALQAFSRTGVSISIPPNFPQSGFVLFAASGKRRTLDVANINVNLQSTDQAFFEEVLRMFNAFRGPWRRWLSIWKMYHCEFVRLHKVRANRVIFGAIDMPDKQNQHMYDWSPRPPDPNARTPPLDPHEFFMAFNSCTKSCLRGKFGWHDCFEPLDGIESMQCIPKRREEWKTDTCPKKDQAWGIQAKLEISPCKVFVYHLLMLIGPFAFWGIWQWYHPSDVQGSSTPATVVLMFMSLWWTVLASGPLLRRLVVE